MERGVCIYEKTLWTPNCKRRVLEAHGNMWSSYYVELSAYGGASTNVFDGAWMIGRFESCCAPRARGCTHWPRAELNLE